MRKIRLYGFTSQLTHKMPNKYICKIFFITDVSVCFIPKWVIRCFRRQKRPFQSHCKNTLCRDASDTPLSARAVPKFHSEYEVSIFLLLICPIKHQITVNASVSWEYHFRFLPILHFIQFSLKQKSSNILLQSKLGNHFPTTGVSVLWLYERVIVAK